MARGTAVSKATSEGRGARGEGRGQNFTLSQLQDGEREGGSAVKGKGEGRFRDVKGGREVLGTHVALLANVEERMVRLMVRDGEGRKTCEDM